ncbi:MAG: hypothetical protein ACOZAM_10600 [Pseudomonadota bacterium]
MNFRLRLIPLIAAAILALSSLSPASAASQCTASQWREFVSLAKQVDSNLRRFENARIKDVCRAGRPLLASLRKADKWIQRHPQCMTARDRRKARRMSAELSRASAEFRRGCGR